jgi:chorismate dehydratase
VRKQAVLRYPELVAEIYQAFLQSKQKSALSLQPLIQEAQSKIGGPADYWRDYFSQLCYDFASEQIAGLRLYFQYALELGLIPWEVPIQIWNDNT